MTSWTDDRIEAALAGLAGAIDLERPGDELAARRRHRPLLVAAAIVLAVVAAALAVPGSRRAVADWFGIGSVTFHRTADTTRVGTATLLDDATPLPVGGAIAETGLTEEQLVAAGLGRPSHAAEPPEGGTVLAWADRGVTLWVAGIDDSFDFSKSLPPDVELIPVPELQYAVVVDGAHDLISPIRVIAAQRVVWWWGPDHQYRLEGDLPTDELVAIAVALAG